jgi:hypothetical protein
VWKRWNAAGTTTTTTPKRKKGLEREKKCRNVSVWGGIFRQLMDDVGSGGKRREERKKKKMVEEFPVIWRADGLVHVRAAADLFQPQRKKKEMCAE